MIRVESIWNLNFELNIVLINLWVVSFDSSRILLIKKWRLAPTLLFFYIGYIIMNYYKSETGKLRKKNYSKVEKSFLYLYDEKRRNWEDHSISGKINILEAHRDISNIFMIVNVPSCLSELFGTWFDHIICICNLQFKV